MHAPKQVDCEHDVYMLLLQGVHGTKKCSTNIKEGQNVIIISETTKHKLYALGNTERASCFLLLHCQLMSCVQTFGTAQKELAICSRLNY